jgi:hypothetical protein
MRRTVLVEVRAKQELSRREPFGNAHGSTAHWAVPEWMSFICGPRCRRSGVLLWAAEQLKAERQEYGAIPVSEKSEVAYAHEARRQNMEQEAAQKLCDSQSHKPLLVAVGGIFPAKCDVAFRECDQPGVGDGDAMGVCAEIAQYMFRSSEGPLGVNDPVVAEQYSQPCGEGARMSQRQKFAVKLKLTSTECVAKPGNEVAAEYAAEHADGKEEGATGGDPAWVIWSETAGGDHAVDMRMKLQALVPTMEHAEETDFGSNSKMPWIAGDLKQGLSAGVKEQVVDEPLVL